MITTAQSSQLTRFTENRLVQTLLLLYGAVWIWAAVNPAEFHTWLLENLLVVAAAIFAVWLYRVRPLSDVSSILILIFMVLHAVGAHYTYSLVPLGEWMKAWGGLERNHYDRIIHFGFGLLITYPVRELLQRSGITRAGWVGFFAFAIISTASGIYELMEWVTAVVVEPEAGTAFLGTQGDPFDSQKDHVLALVGSLAVLALTWMAERSPTRR
jgi:putative membrane protein